MALFGSSYNVFNLINRILALLEHRQKKRLWVLTGLRFIAGVAEIVGLAGVIPYILMVARPESIQEYPTLNAFYQFLGSPDINEFLIIVLLILLVFFTLKNMLIFLVDHLQARFTFNIATHLAHRQANYILHEDYPFFLSHNSNQLVHQTKTIPTLFSKGVLLPLQLVLGEFLMIAVIFLIVAYLNLKILLALAITLLPSVYIAYAAIKNKIKRLGEERDQWQPLSHHSMQQAVKAFTLVKLYNKARFFVNRFVKKQDQIHQYDISIETLSYIPKKAVEMAGLVGILILSFFTLFIYQNPEQLFLFLSTFATASYKLMPSINRVFDGFMKIRGHFFTLHPLENALYRAPKSQSPDHQEKGSISFNKTIALEKISYQFKDAELPVLQDLDLEVEKGELMGIAGKSGSGKSTLMFLLMRFLAPQKGSMKVDNVVINETNHDEWQQLLGFVRHDNFILEDTLAANIAFGLKPEDYDTNKLEQAIRHASLTSFVEELPHGINSTLKEDGQNLSEGQKQRIAIARALYHDAEVFFFDEATNALDPETEREILQAIQTLNKAGKTIFIISHRLSTLQLCNRIVYLDNGTINSQYDYQSLKKLLNQGVTPSST